MTFSGIPLNKIFNVRVFACLSLLFLIFNLFSVYRFPVKQSNYSDYFSGAAVNATVPETFNFTQIDKESNASFKGKVFVPEGGYQEFLYGTFTDDADHFTGLLQSSSFPVDTDYLYVPITGYPNKTGNSLSLTIAGKDGEPALTIGYKDENPAEKIKVWKIDARSFKGQTAIFRVSDQLTESGGWLGIGKPLLTSDTLETSVLEKKIAEKTFAFNYLYFYQAAATILGLIFLPGLAIKRYWSISILDNFAYLPLPGFGLLTGYGFFLWIFKLSPVFGLGKVYLVGMIGTALYLILTSKKTENAGGNFNNYVIAFFYGAVCLLGLQTLSIPVEVAQEMGAGRNVRSGMVASPPDHEIPYRTAVYFFHKKKGSEKRKEYFGDDWSVVSRGPLAAFAINAAFNIFKDRPSDPPQSAPLSFPADDQGMFLARIIGIFTNSFILLSAVYFAACLRIPGKSQIVFCLAWLALSPVVLINTTFLWPKLLAAYFIILALCGVLTNESYLRIGLWIALAYLSHPVGGLFAPCVILFWAHYEAMQSKDSGKEKIWEYFKRIFTLSAAIFLWTLPWTIYKLFLGYPDSFIKYPLGDGRGFLIAENFSSWLTCRWDNLLYTLIPVAFFFSNNMKSWIGGELSEPLRWTVQYAKTLPAQLGFSLFIFAYWLSFKPNRPATLFRLYILAGNLILMILFWGYSSDGLGRNCLEPLSVILIIYTASQISRINLTLKIGLILLCGESFYLIFSGFFANPSFRFESLSYAEIGQFGAIAFTLATILSVALLILKNLTPEELAP